MANLGKFVILAGVILVIAGVVLVASERAGLRLGRLPGDFVWHGKNSVLYFPLATSLLVSLVLTIIFWIVGRMHR